MHAPRCARAPRTRAPADRARSRPCHPARQVEVVDGSARDERLLALLQKHHGAKGRTNRILIFVLYKKEAPRVEGLLKRKGWRASAIHGDISQAQRTAAVEGFKAGTVPLLIATGARSSSGAGCVWGAARARRRPCMRLAAHGTAQACSRQAACLPTRRLPTRMPGAWRPCTNTHRTRHTHTHTHTQTQTHTHTHTRTHTHTHTHTHARTHSHAHAHARAPQTLPRAAWTSPTWRSSSTTASR
jgi:hypothetical protein